MHIQNTPIPTLCSLGRYEYHSNDIIGEGFYGKVYKGRRLSDGKKVAIKVVNMEQHPGQEEREFINNELRIHQMLKHERVVECIEVYKKNNHYYFVTELVEGGDLDQYLREKGPLEEGEALKLLKQIIEGMLYVKQKRVIHRDIKPANIFMKEGSAKVADFGLSTFLFEGKMLLESRIGSPRYMAPEVLHEGLYTFKCDVWSLGVLFIEMVTGEAPLSLCESFQEVVEKVLQPIIPPHLVLSELAMQMLTSMLQIHEPNRISIEELHDHLIFHHIHKHSSVSTNDSEQMLQIDHMSQISYHRSRFSSFSTSFNEVMLESEPVQKQQARTSLFGHFTTTFESSGYKMREDSTYIQDFSLMATKLNGGYDCSGDGKSRLNEGSNNGLGRLEIRNRGRSEIESSDLIEFRNILYSGMSNQLLI